MAERFLSSREPGCYYDPKYICSLSDQDLAKVIKEESNWDEELLRDLCWRADIIDEWDAAEVEDAENIAMKAAEILGVEIL